MYSYPQCNTAVLDVQEKRRAGLAAVKCTKSDNSRLSHSISYLLFRGTTVSGKAYLSFSTANRVPADRVVRQARFLLRAVRLLFLLPPTPTEMHGFPLELVR